MVALIVVAALAAVVWVVYQSSLFEVKEVLVEGNREVMDSEVVGKAGIEPGEILAKISAKEVKERLAKEPWIQDVKVMKEYPSRLKLAITERKPIALLRVGGSLFLVDKYCFVWKNDKDRRLPEIRDLPLSEVEAGRRLESNELSNALLCLGSLGKNTYRQVVSLSAPTVAGFTLQLNNGVLVYYGKAVDRAKKNYVLSLILSRARLQGEKLTAIDVRVASHPVVRR